MGVLSYLCERSEQAYRFEGYKTSVAASKTCSSYSQGVKRVSVATMQNNSQSLGTYSKLTIRSLCSKYENHYLYCLLSGPPHTPSITHAPATDYPQPAAAHQSYAPYQTHADPFQFLPVRHPHQNQPSGAPLQNRSRSSETHCPPS